RIASSAMCGARCMDVACPSAGRLITAPPGMWMRLEIQLSTASIGYVGVQLGRREVGVPEHLLDGSQVGASLQQMRREGMPEEMRVDAFGIEARLRRQAPEDQERARAGERAAACIEEELGPVPCVEERTPAREIAPNRLDCGPADRDDPLLVSFADRAHDPVLEVDVGLRETDRFADAQARPVEELDECAIAVRTRRRAGSSFDESLRFSG